MKVREAEAVGPSNTIRLIVDAMNVIGARPDGWWRDPDAAKRRLVDRLRELADEGEPITVVIDGRAVSGLPEGRSGGVEVRYAGHSAPDAADDLIVELVADRPDRVRVVTSDGTLRRRVEALGAEVERVSSFLGRIGRAEARGQSDEA